MLARYKSRYVVRPFPPWSQCAWTSILSSDLEENMRFLNQLLDIINFFGTFTKNFTAIF